MELSSKLIAENWSLDNWGEDVLAQKFDGSLYYWDTSSGLSSNDAAPELPKFLPPRTISVPRPAILVAIVTEEILPA